MVYILNRIIKLYNCYNYLISDKNEMNDRDKGLYN